MLEDFKPWPCLAFFASVTPRGGIRTDSSTHFCLYFPGRSPIVPTPQSCACLRRHERLVPHVHGVVSPSVPCPRERSHGARVHATTSVVCMCGMGRARVAKVPFLPPCLVAIYIHSMCGDGWWVVIPCPHLGLGPSPALDLPSKGRPCRPSMRWGTRTAHRKKRTTREA